MTKEELQDRIIAINNELTATKANQAKLEGHLAEAHHWLATLFKNESKDLPEIALQEEDKEPVDMPGDCEEHAQAA